MGRYVAGSSREMGPFLRALSALCVSRWGFEAIADVYLHGEHGRRDYAYGLANAVHVSLHPEDARRLRRRLVEPEAAESPLPWQASYAGVLMLFVAIMTLAVGLVLKGNDARWRRS